jgi:hypothetical protein
MTNINKEPQAAQERPNYGALIASKFDPSEFYYFGPPRWERDASGHIVNTERKIVPDHAPEPYLSDMYEFPFSWPKHWFFRYCLPYVSIALLIAGILYFAGYLK